jgi:type II secretory pathway pseudopilin PulG
MRGADNHSRAFTLVEVLACLTFLGILIPVVVSALLTANRAGAVSERSGIAAQLGENRLGELMLNNEWSSASQRGDFGTEWPGYRWELTKADWGNGAMTELTLDVAFQVQGCRTPRSTCNTRQTRPWGRRNNNEPLCPTFHERWQRGFHADGTADRHGCMRDRACCDLWRLLAGDSPSR